MILAFMFGLIAGLALFIGALVGIYLKPSKKTSAKIMAFGSGVLISAIKWWYFTNFSRHYFRNTGFCFRRLVNW